MTSKNLLWNRCVEHVKRSGWLWALNLFLFVVYKNYSNLIQIRNSAYFDGKYYSFIIGIGNSDFLMILGSLFWIVVLASAAGIQGFSYLHSKIKVDMYHSQPVSERARFFGIYLNGLFCYTIPRVIGGLLEAVIVFFCTDGGKPGECLAGSIYRQIFLEVVLEILLYFAVYQIAVLMTILTSQMIFSVICTLVVLCYEMFIRKLIAGFSETFFHTYCMESEIQTRQCKVSVLYLFEQLREKLWIGMSGTDIAKEVIAKGTWIVILSLLTAVISYIAYKKRPLENVKMPFAFQWMQVIFKGMVMVAAILCSIYLMEFEMGQEERNLVWSFGFLLLTAVVFHCGLELLFEKDFKAVCKHKKSTVISAGIVVIVFVIFRFDVLGYDRYVPKEENIESIALVPYEEEGNTDVSENIELYEISGDILDGQREEYILEHMKLPYIKELCSVARDNWKYTWEQAAEQLEKYENAILQQTIFAYHLKNGKTVYRNYYVVSKKGDRRLRNIQQSQEYMQGCCIWLYHEKYGNDNKDSNDRMEENIHSVLWINQEEDETKLANTDTRRANRLRDVLKKDIEQNGSRVRLGEELYGRIVIEDDSGNEYEEEYMIYPQYKDTIACLQEMMNVDEIR